MTATEILRRLLDERGVEWTAYELNPFEKTTSWDIHTNDPTHEVCASLEEFDSGTTLLRFWSCTPEQAIAATLGSFNCTNGERTNGTCHVASSIIDTYEYNRWEYELSCGHTIIWEDSEPPNYCPNCGRRIVDEKEDA